MSFSIQANYNGNPVVGCAVPSGDAAADQADYFEQRRIRLAAFPHWVFLQLSYTEMDYADRWCWQQFGPANGVCVQSHSEYRACDVQEPHSHQGKWMTYWVAKTAYEYGFNEWYFAQREDLERFLEFVPDIKFGENYD